MCPRLAAHGRQGPLVWQVEYRGVVSQQPHKGHQPNYRTPNFPAFLITGGVVGLLIGFFLGISGPDDARYDVSAAVGFLGLIFAALGVLVGGIVAVLLDSRR